MTATLHKSATVSGSHAEPGAGRGDGEVGVAARDEGFEQTSGASPVGRDAAGAGAGTDTAAAPAPVVLVAVEGAYEEYDI